MWSLTLGEADKQVGRREGAGKNSYRNAIVKALAGLAAYPWALCPLRPIQTDREP